MKRIGATGVIISIAGCLGDENDDGGAEDTDTNVEAEEGNYEIGLSVMWSGLSWWDAFIRGGEWYADDQGLGFTIADGEQDAAQQTSDIQSMIASGVDAIIIMPVDSNALVSAVEEATENDIPVFTSNAGINSDDVVRYISWGNKDAAAAAGEALVDALEEKHGEPTGTILAGYDALDYELGVERSEGFEEVIEEYNDIEIVASWSGGGAEDEAFENFYNQLQRYPDVDAIYGANQPKMTGAMQALDNIDRLVPAGEDDHVILSGIDAGPEIMPELEEGYIDSLIDQPTQFYNALLVEMVVEYLDSGQDDDALPQVGDTVTEEDIQLSEYDEHVGTDIWEEPLWAPAEVIPYEHEGEELHPYIKTQSVVIDENNIDEPYLWGNWVDDI